MAWAPTVLLLWASLYGRIVLAAGPFDALVAFNKVFPNPTAVRDSPESKKSVAENAESGSLERTDVVAFSKVFPPPGAVKDSPASEPSVDEKSIPIRKPRSLWETPGPLENLDAAAVERDSARFLASIKPSTENGEDSESARLSKETSAAAAVERDSARFLASVKPAEPLAAIPSNNPKSLEFHLTDPAAVPPPVPEVAAEAPSSASFSFGPGLPDEPSQTCLDTRSSTIKDAGMGLFATCDISAGMRIGEYKGERRMSPSFNHAYEWSVPICSRTNVVVHGSDKNDWAACNPVGKEYIDGALNGGDNPLRFVNGVDSSEQQKMLNISPIFYQGRVFYVTTRDVHAGEEFITDYGAKYWEAHKSLDNYWNVVKKGRLA